MDVHVGTSIPAHCSSMGKALLAALPTDTSADLIGWQLLEPWTPKTITSAPRLTAQLERIRSLSYAINDEETALGLRSVAVAVIDAR